MTGNYDKETAYATSYPMVTVGETVHPKNDANYKSENGSQDEQDMQYFGKKQRLKRQFGFLSIMALVCTLMCTWEGLFSVFLYGLQNGGPAGLIYGYVFCWIGTTAVVASMAELSSMIPLSGGQYNWVSYLAPPRYSKFMSYITGWVTVIGWQAATASLAFLGGTIVQGLIVLNYPSYTFQRWHGTLLFYAVMALAVFINTATASLLPKIEGLIFIVHIVGFFGVLIPLVYLAPHGSAHDVFATFLNEGGYKSDGLSFFIGIVAGVYSFLGADSACHMAEEITNASTVVPWSMIATMFVNGVLGIAMLIAVLFCLGDITDALTTPTGYPFIEIFHQATNSKAGATAMTSIVAALLIFACIGLVATSSRMLWSFARDNGVPFSKYIGRVHAPSALPLYSIAVTTSISLLLALINIGSTAAFNAMVSLVVAGFFSSYFISITLLLMKRHSGEHIRWGPWTMGKWGVYVNAIAMVYIVIAFVFSFFPAVVPVTPANMNWSCLVFGVTIIFSVSYYFLFGRKVFDGPINELQLARSARD